MNDTGTTLFCAWCEQPIDPQDEMHLSSVGACCSEDCKSEFDDFLDEEEEDDDY